MSIEGTVDPRFEPVAVVFADVIANASGTGASLAVWHDGGWVVDLWGGFVDKAHTRPWQADTIAMVYSVTKPFAAIAALVLADRGRLDLDAPLSIDWPEMTAATTMRQVLGHRSGHVVLDELAPEEVWYDWDRLCGLLATQAPAWEPGTEQGEAALFYGHLVGEVVRRVDGRTLGRFLREEVCEPLGLDFHVGLTDDDLPRVADLTGFGDVFMDTQADSTELYARAMSNPPGAMDPAVVNSVPWRRAEIPAINGHGTARGVAGLYVALQAGSILTPEMLADAVAGNGMSRDLVMGDVRVWGLGVGVDPDGYGMGGLGGSVGWWSQVGGYAIGFVTGEIAGYDRAERLENAVRACLGLDPI
jgi:CubicO group peptidase (beta-lactamase class C family)